MKTKSHGKAVTLAPLPFDEAVADILKVKPEQKRPKATAKAPSKRKPEK